MSTLPRMKPRVIESDVCIIGSGISAAMVAHKLARTTNKKIVVVEAGDVREVHHVALLIGYGAAAVNPYLAMETVEDLAALPQRTGSLPIACVEGWSSTQTWKDG